MAKTLLFLGTSEDKVYLPRLKSCVGTATVYVNLEPITTVMEVIMYCKKKGCTGIISTSRVLLSKLLNKEGERKQPSLNDFAGSFFERDGIEIVFINPLEQLMTVPYGQFMTRRFITKLTDPESWNEEVPFVWEMLVPESADRIFTAYQSAFLIACDIETYSTNTAIRCIGFTAIFLDNGKFTSHSCVLPLDSTFALSIARKFFWELKSPKVFQNGKYDIAYLSRHNIIPYNYIWDTATMFHSWYSELPKDLGFLGAFFVRRSVYWKDLADTNDLQQYYLYNCRDHWTTALVALEWIRLAPEWAKKNYSQEFPLLFPCHMSEMIGVKRDMNAMEVARTEVDSKLQVHQGALNRMLGCSVNVNSPPQMKALLKILGCADLDSADEKNLNKAIFRHPLNARILNHVLEIRGLRKLKSTYLRTGADITATSKGGSKEYQGRLLYALNPHGTDTGRLASKEHHFWCGLNIQNIPRGDDVKRTIIADDSFRFAEVDLEQAESRDTAHISGDTNLISAVTGERDFHSINAAAFFGRPYAEIYDDALRKTKDKKLRDLAKRVNHGANYNMGPNVLVDTMGYERIEEARALLNLPKYWTPKQIAEHLLAAFHKTYPNISGLYYPYVVHSVVTTRMLTGATGWTRYCFGNPDKNKQDLNAYVAHCPQSLNAMVLNKAYLKVFYEIALHPTHGKNFKLCAQIHDSILFQFRVGHEYLCEAVKTCMELPVTVKGCDGKTRTFTVPAAIKAGKDGTGATHWNLTE